MSREFTTESATYHTFPQDVVENPARQCACNRFISPAEVAMRLHEDTGHLCLFCYARERRQFETEF